MTTRERPILFKGEMVRAILDGRKTQTRRVVKPQPKYGAFNCDCDWDVYWYENDKEIHVRCPYGQPVDRLWVRETWTNADGEKDIRYRAEERAICCDALYRWRPSIHMPRWASRITLEITSVRVERLQDISEEDAKAEGVSAMLVPPDGGSWPYAQGFEYLWNSLAKPGSTWANNPWVWVIEFKRVEV